MPDPLSGSTDFGLFSGFPRRPGPGPGPCSGPLPASGAAQPQGARPGHRQTSVFFSGSRSCSSRLPFRRRRPVLPRIPRLPCRNMYRSGPIFLKQTLVFFQRRHLDFSGAGRIRPVCRRAGRRWDSAGLFPAIQAAFPSAAAFIPVVASIFPAAAGRISLAAVPNPAFFLRVAAAPPEPAAVAFDVLLHAAEKGQGAVHAQHLSGVVKGGVHVVGHHDDGHPPPAVEGADDGVQLLGGQGVQPGGGLVQQEQLSVAHSARASSTHCCWPPDSSR